MTGNMTYFMKSEKGATVIEYVIIASLIALAMVGTVTALSSLLRGFYQSVVDLFT